MNTEEKQFIYVLINGAFVLAKDYPHLLNGDLKAVMMKQSDPRHQTGINLDECLTLAAICPNFKEMSI